MGPRDGLQNEATHLTPALRAGLCNRLFDAGLGHVEVASFVHPKWVPQMAGAEEVVLGVPRRPGAIRSGLVLNERGYDRALAAGVDEIHYAFPVTDGFAQRNQNTTSAAGLELSHQIVRRARADGIAVSVGLIVAFGCPFDGPVPPERVLAIAEQVLLEPPDELMLADTIGVAVPSQVKHLFEAVGRLGIATACHFHNTRNTGFANAVAALEVGVRAFDSSVGGAGGCPFAPKATGNIATEDLVYLLEGMGVATGVALEPLIEVSRWLSSELGRELPGMLARAGPFIPIGR